MRRRWSLEETKWPRLVLYQQSKPKHVETRVQAVRVQVKAKKSISKVQSNELPDSPKQSSNPT